MWAISYGSSTIAFHKLIFFQFVDFKITFCFNFVNLPGCDASHIFLHILRVLPPLPAGGVTLHYHVVTKWFMAGGSANCAILYIQ